MTYQPPVREHAFLLRDVLDIDQHGQLPSFADASFETVEQILEAAAQFTGEVLAPLNPVGDKQGCVWNKDFTVKTPDGFKDAYAKLVEGGWPALGSDPAYGGQGLPHVVNVAFSEMSSSANMAFSMYPGLTHGCYSAIHVGGTQEQKDLYLPKLCSFQWAGTMNRLMPRVPWGAPSMRASTRWMMFSVRSCSPPLIQIFWPEILYVPSACGTALVRSMPRSVPQCGSVRFMVPAHWNEHSLGR